MPRGNRRGSLGPRVVLPLCVILVASAVVIGSELYHRRQGHPASRPGASGLRPLASSRAPTVGTSEGDVRPEGSDVAASLPLAPGGGSLETYDALLRPDGTPSSPAAACVCDVFTVPFERDRTRRCKAALADLHRWEALAPLAPHFEARTIKFRVTVNNVEEGGDCDMPSVHAILKVPQALFPTEPFSEVAAYAVDRHLGIRRVPPTVLVPVALDRVTAVAESDLGRRVSMVKEHNRAGLTWSAWVAKDVVEYLRTAGDRYMHNRTHVYASVQLELDSVTPLLSCALRLPYSKKEPGWHRWFNPAWQGFRELWGQSPMHKRASLLATSELAMFDFIVRNNDRSPNKNHFVVGGCLERVQSKKTKKAMCVLPDGERAQRGYAPTFVHLDQGMAFNGFPHPHNPIAKPNSSFCVFYQPLLASVRTLSDRDHPTTPAAESELFRGVVPQPAVRALGYGKVQAASRQLTALLRRAASCESQEWIVRA